MERISYSLGSLLSIDEVLACAKKLEQIKPDVMWIPETWGMENFSMMATASREKPCARSLGRQGGFTATSAPATLSQKSLSQRCKRQSLRNTARVF